MRCSRRLVPVLVAVLVIQGLVAVVPHQHESAALAAGTEAGPEKQASLDESHRCLACAVHAPLIVPSSIDENVPVVSVVGECSIIGGECRAAGTDGAPSPRGPPRVS